MPQIGPLEILIVGVLALLVFGPEKLPEIGRSLGKGLHQLKRMASDVKSEFDLSLAEDDEVSPAPTTVTASPVVEPDPEHEAPKAAAGV